MTVLHVVEAIGAGVARHVTDIVSLATGVRHEVALPAQRVGWDTDVEAEATMRAAGAVVHRVEMRRLPVHPANARAWLSLSRLVSQRRPAVVHGHAAVGGALGRLAAWWAPAARVYTPNGLLARPPAVALERMLGRRTDRLVAVSESEAELVTRLHLVPAIRLAVIHNGVDVDSTGSSTRDLRDELGMAAGTPLVAFVGRLGRQKAPEIFVRSCRTVADRRKDVHFLLVGTGPLEAETRREIAASGLGDRLHHVSTIPGVAGLMDQFDVLVLPSRYEGLPYVLLEAMRAGTAVVATDVVGSRDVVEDDVTGLLVPVEDPAATAAAVLRVLDDDALRDRLGAAGQDLVRRQFDVRHMAATLEKLYLELAFQPSRALQ